MRCVRADRGLWFLKMKAYPWSHLSEPIFFFFFTYLRLLYTITSPGPSVLFSFSKPKPASRKASDKFTCIKQDVFVQLLSQVWLWPHELQQARLPCPSLSPGVCSNSCPWSQWCHPTILSSVAPFSSCPKSFPASGSIPMIWFFKSGGQCIGVSASASVLAMNIQGWFPLGLTGLIFLQSKGFLNFSPAPESESISSLALSLLYGPTLTSIHDYWKNHSFDYTDLYWQNDISAF